MSAPSLIISVILQISSGLVAIVPAYIVLKLLTPKSKLSVSMETIRRKPLSLSIVSLRSIKTKLQQEFIMKTKRFWVRPRHVEVKHNIKFYQNEIFIICSGNNHFNCKLCLCLSMPNLKWIKIYKWPYLTRTKHCKRVLHSFILSSAANRISQRLN